MDRWGRREGGTRSRLSGIRLLESLGPKVSVLPQPRLPVFPSPLLFFPSLNFHSHSALVPWDSQDDIHDLEPLVLNSGFLALAQEVGTSPTQDSQCGRGLRRVCLQWAAGGALPPGGSCSAPQAPLFLGPPMSTGDFDPQQLLKAKCS